MTSAAPSTSITDNRRKGFAYWFIFVCNAMARVAYHSRFPPLHGFMSPRRWRRIALCASQQRSSGLIHQLSIDVSGQGLHSITARISELIRCNDSNEGLCTLFLRHTSASLLIQENYDDSARIDLENWLNRLVPEHDPLYTHALEGADDMPAHKPVPEPLATTGTASS